jgi:hypothetical protein
MGHLRQAHGMTFMVNMLCSHCRVVLVQYGSGMLQLRCLLSFAVSCSGPDSAHGLVLSLLQYLVLTPPPPH